MKRFATHLTTRGQEQKEVLVNAAYDIIAEHGFEGLRTRSVAERAGVNIATLHYYFPKKEDLIKGVSERLLEEFSTVVDPELGPIDLANPEQTLKKEFADQQYTLRVHPQSYIVLMELYTRSLRDDRIRAIIKELILHWEGHLASFLSAGITQGVFPGASDLDSATKLLQCTLIGTVVNLLLFGNTYPVSDVQRLFSTLLSSFPR
jgi:AcrR family transcriptional regulator